MMVWLGATLILARELLGHSHGPVLREPDGSPDGRRVLEHEVDLFEVATHGLGEQEVHRHGHAGRDDGEHDVVLPADGVDSYGSDHSHDEVPVRLG